MPKPILIGSAARADGAASTKSVNMATMLARNNSRILFSLFGHPILPQARAAADRKSASTLP
jgi:hypothetical protein